MKRLMSTPEIGSAGRFTIPNAMQAGIRSGLLAILAGTALVACGGGDGGSTATTTPTPPALPASSGTLRVALTDAPACGFDQVNVTVERVRVHQSSTAGDNDGGWVDIPVINGPRKVDLLSLTNGVLMELGETTLTAGYYSQVRLVLVSNKSASMSNTVKPTGAFETEMDTPSAAQSGLKLINGFTVAPAALTDIVLDFDACKSIVQRGNGTYGLKPVITMIPRSLTAISGYVQAGLTGVTVTAQKDGIVLKGTQPAANGYFALAPLDPAKGPYDVVFTGTNLTTSVIAAVPVAGEQTTTLNSSADPVPMLTSPSGTLSGNVGPAGTRETGSARALQAVGTVPAIEVAAVNVDSITGNYSLFVPTVAPRLLVYSNPMITPLDFQAQAASAGKYKVEASATGYVTQVGNEVTAVFDAITQVPAFALVTVAP
jgi:hypothetical protein